MSPNNRVYKRQARETSKRLAQVGASRLTSDNRAENRGNLNKPLEFDRVTCSIISKKENLRQLLALRENFTALFIILLGVDCVASFKLEAPIGGDVSLNVIQQ
jgi:hypothetical protein